jgi:hypothetical protein
VEVIAKSINFNYEIEVLIADEKIKSIEPKADWYFTNNSFSMILYPVDNNDPRATYTVNGSHYSTLGTLPYHRIPDDIPSGLFAIEDENDEDED